MSNSDGIKVVTVNRRALHEYEVLQRIEAGLVLTGTEIKSIRLGRVNVRDAFARPLSGELWLVNLHIAPYAQGNLNNHESTRPRKLLLHKGQMTQLMGAVGGKGLTLVPLRLYLKRHVAKVELGLARGRKQYDKRRVIQERDRAREARQGLRRRG